MVRSDRLAFQIVELVGCGCSLAANSGILAKVDLAFRCIAVVGEIVMRCACLLFKQLGVGHRLVKCCIGLLLKVLLELVEAIVGSL